MSRLCKIEESAHSHDVQWPVVISFAVVHQMETIAAIFCTV